MTAINLNDYVLVKDKDGQLKYYKDGQFYSIEEIETQIKGEQEKKEEKKEPVVLKPVITLEEKKQVKKQKPDLEPLKISEEVEDVKPVEELSARRSEDQKVIEEKVQDIISKLKIQFSDETIKRRFVNILTTYFRGIRKVKEIEYILTTPKVSGGMELPVDKVALIISLLSHHTEDTHKKRQEVVSKPLDRVATLDHRLDPPPPAVVPKASPAPEAISVPVPKVSVPQKPKTMARPVISKPAPSQPSPMTKSKVEDVRPVTRQLTGPLEELQYMTIEDFRRLGRDENEIKDEVMERIMLLNEESFVRKIQGIKAWKSSPVFKTYLLLSLRGIREKKTVEQLIEENQRQNIETLTISEYEAISDLNQKLSY